MKLSIEFGLFADELNEQLKEFNIPNEKVAIWQGIADFIITASITHAITDKAHYKLNNLLGSIIAKEIQKKYESEGEG
jgi:hypothetical protein